MRTYVGVLLLVLIPSFAWSQPLDFNAVAASQTETIIKEIAEKSFPEIKIKKLRVKTFVSDDSFFMARYSIWRYATFQRMRHIVYVNPKAFEREIPASALRAVLAHELAHVDYYTRKNRLQLLGLLRLSKASSRAEFERKADLAAIIKGYGAGLIEYRRWLYKQIPPSKLAEKERDYFSPDEIRLVIKAMAEKPALIAVWSKKVPRSIEDIKRDTGYE